ncbi:MAG: hypothetical protein KAX49_13500 [Halanaerobiales bacterium]|nr:hypothetical protein [Halanaerobiales bacterium]
MLFVKQDFIVPNISNIPTNKEKFFNLIDIFYQRSYTLKELNSLSVFEKMKVSKTTFRKIINHCVILGILCKMNNKYALSKDTKRLAEGDYEFEEFIYKLISRNKGLNRIITIIILLLKIFTSLRSKTLYTIFAFIGKDRVDDSAISSVGRNLRAIFSLLKMLDIIQVKTNTILLNNFQGDLFECFNVLSLESNFFSEIIYIDTVTDYLSKFFDVNVSKKILACVSTYEIRNYIWTKGSLFKDQGEIKNLHGEYITTVMLNERR